MKKNLLFAIVGILTFFLILKLIPYSNKTSGTVNYAPEGFKKTIETGISGKVVNTEQRGQFWVTINDGTAYPFSYSVEKLPLNWKANYPKDFIIIGDSISKNINNDTFYVIRDTDKWIYVLPK